MFLFEKHVFSSELCWILWISLVNHWSSKMSGIKGFRFEFLDALQSLADCDIRCKNELGYFLQLTVST